MEGQDFAAPAHLLSERSASGTAPSGHSSVQHDGHFSPGKYYPSHIPMAPHSGSGLMGNTPASFMGTFLASSLGSTPHPSRPPSSPSSPSFRGGPQSNTSQIWFPHSHEGPGYPRFSGSLTHAFLPMNHLDHHANSGVLYGQHCFYDTQKENFYQQGLPSQPSLISANHSLPPMSRAGSGHSHGSCSRDRDPELETYIHKGLKDSSVDRGVILVRDKERSSRKHDAKERLHQQQHHSHQTTHHDHSHSPQQQPHYPQQLLPLEDVNSWALERDKALLAMEYSKEHPQMIGKSLSACLHNGKMQNGAAGAATRTKVSMPSCGGEGAALRAMGDGGSSQGKYMGCNGGSRCTKQGVSGEMRIREQPLDCLERGPATLHHSLPYPVPPPLHISSATEGAHNHPHPLAHPQKHPHPGGFHCLQLHPSHPHHPHNSHHTHHHADFFCPPRPAHLANLASQERGAVNARCEPKVTGPSFVPCVADLGDKSSEPFQLSNLDCHGVGGGGGGNNTKDKAMDKRATGGHHSSWDRKLQQQQQQHPYRKTEKVVDWMQSHPQHVLASLPPLPQQQQQKPPHSQQQHLAVHSQSAECINSGVGMDGFRSSLSQGPKAVPHSVNTPLFKDCSHQGPPPISSSLADNKDMVQHTGAGAAHGQGGSCSLQRDGQKVAKIRHQQHDRPGPDAPSAADMNQRNSQELKRKVENSPYGYTNNNGQHHHQQPSVPPWDMMPPHCMSHSEEEQRKSYIELGSSAGKHPQQQQQQPGMNFLPPQPQTAPPLNQQQPQSQQQPDSKGTIQGESSAMKCLLKYSHQQRPLLFSLKSPFGGLGSLKSGPAGESCALQGKKQTQSSRKGPADAGQPDYSRGRRDMGEMSHGEREVRQPPVGIAVAVARQREPPCHVGTHPNSHQGRVQNSVRDPTQEERKKVSDEQMGLTCLDRDKDAFISHNKEQVKFARIHPSNSCHGDLTSHLMVPGGTSLPSSQLGDPAAHSAHHHWMPRTGSSSLWMTGRPYGIGHTTFHQNLPPGFSSAVPGPLQPVRPLPQDPPAQPVVLPSEPPAHHATHHLDVIEHQGLWPPLYSTRGPPSHMGHPAVYSRSQFLRQQELYAFQQLQHQHQSHQSQQLQLPSQPQLQHRAEPSMQHQATHNEQIQKRLDEQTNKLQEPISEPRTSNPSKAYSYNPPQRNASAPATHLPPCCQSPLLHLQYPRSTHSTPCPSSSPVEAAPRQAISPASSQMLKGAESQDKSGEGQAPQEYPDTLEPDLSPGFTYPAIAMSYRSGPSPQDVCLAEPASLEATQAEAAKQAPQYFVSLGDKLECQGPVIELPEPLPLKEVESEEEGRVIERVLEQKEGVEESIYVLGEGETEEQNSAEEDVLVCPPTERSAREAASCPVSPSTEDPGGPEAVITLDEEDEEEAMGRNRQVGHDQNVIMPGESKPKITGIIELDPAASEGMFPKGETEIESKKENRMTSNDVSVEIPFLSPASASACSPTEESIAVPHKPLASCYWSLELLIAAAFCTDVPPFSLFPCNKLSVVPSQYNPNQGMELLSELADLEQQQMKRICGKSQGDELLLFDLQSFATLASARALELGSLEGSNIASGRHFPACRSLNLRRMCSWTHRDEPAYRAKVNMETLDRPELAMRVKLAEIQRRYKEKQKELAKLQRKHDHHRKEEMPRSPARRGPGRPRKMKPTLTTGPFLSTEGQQKVKSMEVGLCLSSEDFKGSGDTQRRKKRMSSQSFERLSSSQIKAQSCRKTTVHSVLDFKLAGDVTQVKQKTKIKKNLSGSCTHDKEGSPCNSNPKHGHRSQSGVKVGSRQDSGGQSNTGSVAEGEVKLRKKPTCRLGVASMAINHQWSAGPRRTCGTRLKESRSKESRWGSLGTRGNHYRRSVRMAGMATFPTISERLKRATCKNTMLRGTFSKSCYPFGASSLQGEEGGCKDQESKGRAVSHLLESFAFEEGFQMAGNSFSEKEDQSPSHNNKSTKGPNCVLTKELLCDGLKVLISKEDELLYAAKVHTTEMSDIFSVVIDGERGNLPRIYSQEQLIKEAVLDICPESDTMLSEGTRVCAYWSKRSRCLYPGYVRRDGLSDDGKPGGVMVEFDDGDRGKIFLPNIRLLPPAYQIFCKESSPALLAPSGETAKSCLELAPITGRPLDSRGSTSSIANTAKLAAVKRRPGRPKGSGKKQKLQQAANASKGPSTFLGRSSLANPRKSSFDSLLQFSEAPTKTLRGKKGALFSLPQTQPMVSLPGKELFSSSSFEIDSFRSIANGYSSFCTQSTGGGSGLSLGSRSGAYGEMHRQEERVTPKGSKSRQDFLVKLDHEGVTSPKTKNSKSLFLQGDFSSVTSMPKTKAYRHPFLLVKDKKKGGTPSVELFLKRATPQRKPFPSLRQETCGYLGFKSHRECHTSYSDLEDKEEEMRQAALAAEDPRMAGRFHSRLSVSSSSSSSSSSGSLSSSSLCSSDNDSSFSSDDEDRSALMLQTFLSSHQGLRQSNDPSTSLRPQQHSFVAKAMAVSSTKGSPSGQVSISKSLKRKECMISISKTTKEFVKKPWMLSNDASFIPRPKMSAILVGCQIWRWSGNPMQKQGLKGKARKLFYKAIVRGRDTIRVGDCAVFVSKGRPNLPFVGQIESFWESWTSRMVVKVRWFYHPKETKVGKRLCSGKHALYQSCHQDENDVQAISHKCRVVSREEYEFLTHNQKPNSLSPDLYYLAGTYDPTTGQLFTVEGISIMC
uniref:BAH domain and coiled-coil containing 1 n=1 Tax=Nothobranchius furzeri TaxID=105023 RepID=A0A1A8U9E3_NOTFU|nr:BAH and coiled-coil domain-containing protein 1 isoform X2 [Nothobranchius furzeri]